MFPQHLLPALSPNAAKVYLVLLSLVPDRSPLINAPISTLSRLSALAPRTCSRALAELRHLHLIRTLPHSYHGPFSHQLLHFASSPAEAAISSSPPSQSAIPPSSSPPQASPSSSPPPQATIPQPSPPPQAHNSSSSPSQSPLPPTFPPPQAAHSSTTRTPTLKNASSPPQASLLNPSAHSAIPASSGVPHAASSPKPKADDLMLPPALLDLLGAQLSPTEKNALRQFALHQLAELDRLAAAAPPGPTLADVVSTYTHDRTLMGENS